MEKFAKKLQMKNYTLNIFNDLSIEEGVIRFSDMINADMIAMGTHGRRGLSHFMYGSKTENIAGQSKFLLWTSLMKTK